MINIHFTQEEILDLVKQAVSKAEDYLEKHQWKEAEAILRQTLLVHPEEPNALRMISMLLVTQQRPKEAIPYYEKLLELEPDDYEALNNAALCYSADGNIEKSIQLLTRCVRLFSDLPVVHWNLAIQYKESGNFDKAYEIYENAIEKLPNDPGLRYNYAICLTEGFRFEDARIQYEKAVELDPEFAAAHFNLSLNNLLVGNYKEGWKGYEWRFEHAQVFKKFKQRFANEWRGEDGHGKTILVYNEQGSGDAIQFARFLPELKAKGFTVVVEASQEIIELLAGCEGVDQVVLQRSKKIPPYDYSVSIGSISGILEIENNLWQKTYVKPTGEIENAFKNYEGLFKIGICWAGNPVHKNDKNRSCFLKHFKPLNDLPGVKLFSLQKDIRPRFWDNMGVVDLTDGCENMSVVDMGDLLVNFNYTAAIMQNMDVIVTVDSAVAHIAGAMGLRCYLLLPHMPDWRWGLESESTPWYPTVKLMRQSKPGDYESVINKIVEELK